MKIVLVGLGKIGVCIVQQLSKEGHDIVCIDTEQENVDMIVNTYDVMAIKGNAENYDILKEAGVDDSDLFIAATSSDEANIVSCILAKKLGTKKTIARIRNPELHKHIEVLKEGYGIDYPLNPENETALEISKVISFPSALTVDSFAHDKADLIAYTIKEGSPLINKEIKDIVLEYEGKVLFVTVKRDEETFIPYGDFIIQENDILYILGEKNEVQTFMDSIGNIDKMLKNVMIIGCGYTGQYLINYLLENKHHVKIIESSKERCVELVNQFPKADIIHGDGTDQEVLLKEGIKNCDVVCSLANLDEENILIGMFAKTCGVKKIIIKVNKDSLTSMIKEVTDLMIITAKEVTAEITLAIARSLESKRGSKIVNISKLVKSKVYAVTFVIKPDCKLIGKPLKDMKIKENNIIGSIIRNNQIIIPNGSDTFQSKDEVLVVTKNLRIEAIEQIMR